MLLEELHQQGVTRQQIENALAKIPFVSILRSQIITLNDPMIKNIICYRVRL